LILLNSWKKLNEELEVLNVERELEERIAENVVVLESALSSCSSVKYEAANLNGNHR